MTVAEGGAAGRMLPVMGRLLHRDPPIVFGPNLGHDQLAPASRIAPLLGDRPAWTLIVVHWSLEVAAHRRALVADWQAFARAYPRHKLLVLCNTEAERALLAAEGVRSAHCNHNMLVDERVFDVMPGRAVEFDAVYNARLEPYKRHHLARDVARLALIYSEFERSAPDYVAAVRAALPQAVFVNEAIAHSTYARPAHARAAALINRVLAARRYTTLTQQTVVDAYNSAATGLCLSEVEGAMYASMEYLLAGLPVVTTPSIGGRDHFFHPDYALSVAPDPAAVRDGVAAMIRRAIPRAQIRAAVLDRVRAERLRFLDVLHGIFVEAGAEGGFEAAVAGLFVGRPWSWQDRRDLAGLTPEGAAR